ncbi:MAG: aminotransferase class I/II-fold pyridoxal phosphate-dependent enzyme [Undibacterium sp.]|nr:aminotransferase class I/II-fold pyridoxal phosphate-dependent enzyme [Opitutaceae bacterium]
MTPDGGGRTSDVGRQSSALQAAALSSGTAALHLALKLVGLQRGEEVFCSSLTFSASANPIVYEGGLPVFIDCERASWNMDPVRLEEALVDRAAKGRLPRAVIVVHLYGQCADLDAIMALCNRYGVDVIEDAAEALGATYYGRQTADGGRRMPDDGGRAAAVGGQPSDVGRQSSGIAPGTVGRLGIFSFNGNKIITTSGGGMLVSHEEALIKKARFLATQARDPASHYQHSEIGYNYRMSNVLAGIGRGQLQVLADRVNARRANCAYYEKAFADLPGISFMPEAPWNRCTRWLTCILVDPAMFGADREAIRLALEAENIEARPVWKPMHLQPIFKDCAVFGGAVSERLFENGLCLPSGSNLTTDDLERVVEVMRRCAGR